MRDKLGQYNTISDAVNLIRSSRRIVILTGAGISECRLHIIFLAIVISFFTGVSCGIPDFRSHDGLYASLKDRGEYDLDDPQQMYGNVRLDILLLLISFSFHGRFDINYFRENPSGKNLTDITTAKLIVTSVF
jgi:hypothetical protein